MDLFDKTFKMIRTTVWVKLFPPTRVSFLLCRWTNDRRAMAEYHEQTMAEIIQNNHMQEFTAGILYHWEPVTEDHRYVFVTADENPVPEEETFKGYDFTGVAIFRTEDLKRLNRTVSNINGKFIINYEVRLGNRLTTEVPFTKASQNEQDYYHKIYELLRSTWMSIGLHTSKPE
jgi:hypothetical protein